MSEAIDLYVLYQIVKRIATPFEETEAYKIGLIDKKGKRIKKATSYEEKKAMTYLDRFVFNIKRALSKAGLDSKTATYAGALYLLRESNKNKIPLEEEILSGIYEELQYLNENTFKEYNELVEDAPVMSTGAAVVGTGDDPIHWRKKGRPRARGRAIDGVAFLKRMNKKRVANNVVSKIY